MARARRYWLMKCEPEAYSIDDLERDGSTCWEGVRNFQARNYLRDDFAVGDGVLFYASNSVPSGVAGLAEVSRSAYADSFAFEPKHDYFDPKSDPENPTWYMVDVKFVEKYAEVVPLETLKTTPGLEEMMVIRKGMRLSIQPIAKAEFEIVKKLGRALGRSSGSGQPEKKAARKR